MKQIKVNVNELTAAYIDDKDVSSDWIADNLFDDGNYVREKNEAMGFIGGFPAFATWSGYTLGVRMIKRGFMFGEDWSEDEIEAFHNTIIEHLAGNDFKDNGMLTRIGSCIDFLCEDSGIVMRFRGDSLHNMSVFFFTTIKE